MKEPTPYRAIARSAKAARKQLETLLAVARKKSEERRIREAYEQIHREQMKRGLRPDYPWEGDGI